MDTSIATELETIQSQAPAKEPRKYPTVSLERMVRGSDEDAAAEVVQQAFDEGYARAMWEVCQQLEPVVRGVLIKCL